MVCYHNLIKDEKIKKYIDYLSVVDYNCCGKTEEDGYSVPKIFRSKKPVVIIKNLKTLYLENLLKTI